MCSPPYGKATPFGPDSYTLFIGWLHPNAGDLFFLHIQDLLQLL